MLSKSVSDRRRSALHDIRSRSLIAVKAEGRHKMSRAMDGEPEWRRRTTTPAVVVAATATPPSVVSTTTPQSGQCREVTGPNGRTLAEYYTQMRRRCIGCGQLGHRHEACPHKDKVCDYCRGKGHLRTVCSDRFLGRPQGGRAQRGQQVAASSETPFSLFSDEGDDAEPLVSTDF